MAKNPDPSYWGNPPQTPTKTTTPHYSTTPQNPYQPNSQQGYQAPGPIPNQAPQPNAPKPPRKHPLPVHSYPMWSAASTNL